MAIQRLRLMKSYEIFSRRLPNMAKAVIIENTTNGINMIESFVFIFLFIIKSNNHPTNKKPNSGSKTMVILNNKRIDE